MLSFLRRNQVLISAFLSVLLSLYIIAPAAKGRHRADPIGPLMLAIMRPLQSGIQSSVVGIRNLFLNYAALRGLGTENERLKARVRDLEAERSRLLEEESTNKRLRELMDFRSEWAPKAKVASVIASSASAWFQTLILDKGKADGVEKGMAVVSRSGGGRVVSVASRSSKVLLVTDPRRRGRDGAEKPRARIVTGSRKNRPGHEYVKRATSPKETARRRRARRGFPNAVGTVSKVTGKTSACFSTSGNLAVDPRQLEEVPVVR
jgi:rod shape-determining protein MreC